MGNIVTLNLFKLHEYREFLINVRVLGTYEGNYYLNAEIVIVLYNDNDNNLSSDLTLIDF